MSQNQTESKPSDTEQPSGKGLDNTACSVVERVNRGCWTNEVCSERSRSAMTALQQTLDLPQNAAGQSLAASPCFAVARKGDYVFDPDVPIHEARELVVAYHYSRGASNTRTDLHGFRRNGVLVAVAWWLPPTRVACESVSKTEWTKVVSLSRLVVHPDEPKNVCSMLIGASIRQLKKEGRWRHLVTYADHGEGHTGAIYRATNWEYVGTTGPYPKWIDPEGKQTACKATKNRTKQQMEDLGMKMVGRFHKEKFVMHLFKQNSQTNKQKSDL